MAGPLRRIGIMGGTFDPIHYGHLAAAAGARHALGLERILFMPNRLPPHKRGQATTNAAHRLAMVRLALEGARDFEVSTFELDREGPSYTTLTLAGLKSLQPDWDLHFIAGADSLLEIKTWYEYPRLLQFCWFVAVTRPGAPLDRLDALKSELGPELAGRIRVLELPGVAVSSSLLRERIGQGAPITYLVPPGVEQYIQEHRLYR